MLKGMLKISKETLEELTFQSGTTVPVFSRPTDIMMNDFCIQNNNFFNILCVFWRGKDFWDTLYIFTHEFMPGYTDLPLVYTSLYYTQVDVVLLKVAIFILGLELYLYNVHVTPSKTASIENPVKQGDNKTNWYFHRFISIQKQSIFYVNTADNLPQMWFHMTARFLYHL